MKIGTLTNAIHLKQFKQFFQLSSIVLLVLTISFACHDKTNNEDMSPCGLNPGSCKSVLEAKDFFLFKMGSFWVYEEENSQERDSLYVTQYINDEEGYGFYIKIKSSLTDYEYTYWPSYYPNIEGCSSSLPVNKRCIYINRAKGKFQDDLGESIVYFINNHVGESISTGAEWNYCQSNHLTFAAIYDSLLIVGNYFDKVVRVDQECEFAEGKQPTKFYYSKNIGIVRKEFVDSNEVWNLVNYHVIQ